MGKCIKWRPIGQLDIALPIPLWCPFLGPFLGNYIGHAIVPLQDV